MATLQISRAGMEEVEQAFTRYEELLAQRLADGGLAPTSHDTYRGHAEQFVRWLRGEFNPGERKAGGVR